MRRLGWILPLAILLTDLCGCAQLLGSHPLKQRRKFTVVALPIRTSLPHSERPYPFRVQVKKVEISRLYDRDQLVSRLSAYEVVEDRWNSWAYRPGDMLTSVVERYLLDAQLFAGLGQEFLDERPDYVFASVVKTIERFAQGPQDFAHLAMAMRLVDAKSGEALWSAEFDKVAAVNDPDIGATVEALSTILHDQLESAVRDLDYRFLNLMRQRRGLPPITLAELATAAVDTAATESEDATATIDYDLLPGRTETPETR